MPAAAQTIALLAPTIAAQAVFSGRRAKKGVDNMDENPIFALMNIDIALGQFLKGSRAVKSALNEINGGASSNITKASEATKTLGESSKILKGFGKVIDFTAYHINPIIWASATVKGLTSKNEDKPTAVTRELLPVFTMRLAEEGYNHFAGMPITKKIDGVQQNIQREGLYTKLFKPEQLKAMNEFMCR